MPPVMPKLNGRSNPSPVFKTRGARNGKLVAIVAIGGILQACSGDPMERCAEAGLSLDQTRETVEEAASRATSFQQLAEAQETVDQAEEEAIQACSDACSEAKQGVAQAEEAVRQAQEALDQTSEGQALAEMGDPFSQEYPAFFRAYKTAYRACPSRREKEWSDDYCESAFDRGYRGSKTMSVLGGDTHRYGIDAGDSRTSCGDGWGESCAGWTQRFLDRETRVWLGGHNPRESVRCTGPNRGCAEEAFRASIQLFQEYLLADLAWTQASEALEQTSEAEAVRQAENAGRPAVEALSAVNEVHPQGCWR